MVRNGNFVGDRDCVTHHACDCIEAERVRLKAALERIAVYATYGYQDLGSGGVLSHVRKVAQEALDRG